MKKEKRKNNLILLFLVFGVFVFLLYFNYCVPITGDDIMFMYNELSIENILFFGNGRFIGNILADIVQVPVLAIMERSIVTISIVLLICKLLDNFDPATFCITSICVLLPSSNIFSETYSWNAGYQNYVVPIFFILTCAVLIKAIYINKPSKVKKAVYLLLIIVLGFTGQFFSENTSVFTVAVGGILFLYMLVKNKKFDITSFLYTASTFTGFAIMMISPYILGVNDKMNGYREVQTSVLSLIKTAANNYFSFALSFTGNYIVFAIISIAFILMISDRKVNFKNINLFKSILILLPVLSIFLDNFIYQTTKPNVYIKMLIILAIPVAYVTSVLFIILKIGLKNLSDKEKFALYAFSAAVISFIPLLFVSPVGGRTFYLTYICVLIGAICLLPDNIKNITMSKTICICMLLAYIISFSFAFTDVKYSYELREEYLQKQIDNEVRDISIPILPNQRYIHSDTSRTHWEFYFTQEADHEVNFSFTDWESWVIKNDIPH